jgi:hypothetical protein
MTKKGLSAVYPTQAKVRLEWGTHPSLPSKHPGYRRQVEKLQPSPEGLGINPEDDLSAVGAALNRYRLFQHLQIERRRLHAVHLANLA